MFLFFLKRNFHSHRKTGDEFTNEKQLQMTSFQQKFERARQERKHFSYSLVITKEFSV